MAFLGGVFIYLEELMKARNPGLGASNWHA
jgi:hypothetical protein